MAAEVRRVLVYGGRGALGSKCVDYFTSKNWWVASIDVTENAAASANVLVKLSDSFTQQSEEVTSAVDQLLDGKKVDAILCVAGGWAGGSAKAKSFYKNCDLMWKQSVWTSIISSHLATKHLNDGGLLTLSGANAGLSATPGMIAYGMAKAAVHQLCQSLGGEKSGLPSNSAAIAILPVTLDTPANRASMPDADFSSWTPLDFIAENTMHFSCTHSLLDHAVTTVLGFRHCSPSLDSPPVSTLGETSCLLALSSLADTGPGLEAVYIILQNTPNEWL